MQTRSGARQRGKEMLVDMLGFPEEEAKHFAMMNEESKNRVTWTQELEVEGLFGCVWGSDILKSVDVSVYMHILYIHRCTDIHTHMHKDVRVCVCIYIYVLVCIYISA